MRRPLFWVCIMLSVISLIHLRICDEAKQKAGTSKDGAGILSADSFQVTVSGRVLSKENRRQKSCFVLQTQGRDKLICYLPEEELPRIGSSVTARGDYSAMNPATNPGEFDYQKYYRSRGISGSIGDTAIQMQSASCDRLGEALFKLRSYFAGRLDRILPEREAGIMKKMLLGDKTGLDPELRDLYQKSGIIHILSISGLHITLLGMGLFRLLRRAGMHIAPAAVLAGLVLVCYGIMTGMSVSAYRAIGMFLMRMLAVLWKRTYDLMTSLAVMAAIMLCTEPVYGFQSGFWLSFGSVLGVGAALPVLETIGQEEGMTLFSEDGIREKSVRRIKTLVSGGLRSGISVYLITLPLLLLFYFEIPVYSMLVNLFVIPVMGIVVFCGFIAMAIPGFGFLAIADLILLRIFEGICMAAKALPLSAWNPGCPRMWQVILYYVLIAALLTGIWICAERCREKKGNKRGEYGRTKGDRLADGLAWIQKTRCGRSLLWAFLLSPVLLFAIPVHRGDSVTLLDVGQGDCIIARLQSGQTFLFDCGSSSRSAVGEKILIPYLKHEGIRKIDAVFISHGDADHRNGLEELFRKAADEEIQIGPCFLPDLGAEGTRAEFAEFLENIGGADSAGRFSFRRMKSGDRLSLGNLTIRALHPGAASQVQQSTGKQASQIQQSTGSAGKQAVQMQHSTGSAGKQASQMQQSTGSEARFQGNEASLCLYLEFGDPNNPLTLLLTGDVEGDGEKALLSEMKRIGLERVSVLKCAHHGSKNATSEAFLEQLDAGTVLISCGRRNRYGHPHEELLERVSQDGSRIFRTDQGGAVRVCCWKGEWYIQTYLNGASGFTR